MLFTPTSLQTPGSPRIRRATPDGSGNVAGDTPFKPAIFFVGVAVILVFAVGWKLRDNQEENEVEGGYRVSVF